MRFWYRNSPSWQAALLWPLSLITRTLVRLRMRRRHGAGYGVPVLVVGNITVGGTGKSPAIQSLVRYLSQQGLRCGIVSRGYGGSAKTYPLNVTPTTDAGQSGDEPLLLARTLDCPVVVDPDRHQAVKYLLTHHKVDLVISDDGLQHYRMGRSLELVMLDGERGLGNGLLLPAGPLREPASRLNRVNWIVAKGKQPPGLKVDGVMTLNPLPPTNGQGKELAPGTEVDVCAGIGDPAGFLEQMRQQGYLVRSVTEPGDHKAIPPHLLRPGSGPLVMTEKDAIKLPEPWPDHCYVVRLLPQLPGELLKHIEEAIRSPEQWLA